MDKCVLIVDDNDFNRELVKDILEDEDITVYEAEDGSSAIELLESEQSISGKAHFLVRTGGRHRCSSYGHENAGNGWHRDH